MPALHAAKSERSFSWHVFSSLAKLVGIIAMVRPKLEVQVGVAGGAADYLQTAASPPTFSLCLTAEVSDLYVQGVNIVYSTVWLKIDWL